MPRQKKSDVEVLVDILEGGKLAFTDYLWIEKIVARKLKNTQARQIDWNALADVHKERFEIKETKDAGEKRGPEKADGRGPGKSSFWKKDKDGYIGPEPEEVREEKQPKKEKE